MTTKAITVEVTAPDGLPALKASLFAHPETAEEFDAVVDAMGGPAAFRYYRDSNFATADLNDGGSLYLYQPKSADAEVRVTRYPFLAEFAERISATTTEAEA